MMRQSWFRYNAPEIDPMPMSEALPSPASQMMFGNAPFHFPLRIIASYAAATPAVKLPALQICVCAQGTIYGVHSLEHFLRHPIELFENNRLAAHSGHERHHQRPRSSLVQRRAHLCVQHAAAAHAAEAHVGLDNADDLEPAQHVLDALGRIRADGSE